MDRTIRPAARIGGVVRLPGDKSISHRYGMLAAIADGPSEITNYSTGADCASTLACMRALGVEIEHEGSTVRVAGVGRDGLKAPAARLDCGNSGSTIRMLSGILAGQPFISEIAGDESIARRPMKRVITPLELMGAKIEARDGEFAPLRIHGGKLHGIDYKPPVASAQVKTCTLFAGLFAEGFTSVTESVQTRNHSELALRRFGATVETSGLVTRLEGGQRLTGQNLPVPSDLSSAAFFIAAALLLPGSELCIEDVGLNPTRAELLTVLQDMGAKIQVTDVRAADGETIGTLVIEGPASAGQPVIQGGTIEGATTAGVIDEVPMLAVLGAYSRDGLEIRDAGELRVKETDRIATVAENLRRMGADVVAFPDGLRISGGGRLRGAELDSFGDHRIAMAFAIAALRAKGESVLHNAEAASVSFPEFYDKLDGLL
ncbi:MAG: 3-phosphoshikimate 1-carboxyvinyltransferase [Acidobacteria bacterium]|nr:3-phosphoshikimate 1-carboxyvinyltransferase [Acidobacteriota bacterium]